MTIPNLPENLLGRTIAGKYRVEKRIGQGAMGSVWLCRQVALDKLLALKVMNRSLASMPGFVERFHREAQVASRIEHPNSIRVFDHGVEPDGLLYVVMEWLDGQDLASLLMRHWPLSELRIVDLLGQVLSALAVAHAQGVVHRDLKPENVMIVPGVDDDGQSVEVVKVCDFGIAGLVADQTIMAEPRRLTAQGLVVGTPEYMSPEQARGEAVDGRSDLYAVGVLLFQMLTGRLPFVADSALGVAIKQVTEVPPQPSSIRSTISEAIERVCLRALSKSPDARYRNAREMRTAMREAVHAPISSRSWSGGPSAPAARAGIPATRPSLSRAPSRLELSVDRDDEAMRATFPVACGERLDGPLMGAPQSSARPVDSVEPLESDARLLGPSRRQGPRFRPIHWVAGTTAVASLAGVVLALLIGGRSQDATVEHVASPNPSVHDRRAATVAGVTVDPADGQVADDAEQRASVESRQGKPSSGVAHPHSVGFFDDSTDDEEQTEDELEELSPPPSDSVGSVVASAAGAGVAPAIMNNPGAGVRPSRRGATLAKGASEVACATCESAAASESRRPVSADRARVWLGAVSTTGALSAINVRRSLDLTAILQCYRHGLMRVDRERGGEGTLSLRIAEDGRVTSAQWRGGPALGGMSRCIQQAARSVRISEHERGGGSAVVAVNLSAR